jgi:hypothetical protein
MEAFEAMRHENPGLKFGKSIGIQCNGPDLLFVDACVPKTLASAGFRASLAPFGERKEPTFAHPIPFGKTGKARDLGNANLKVATVYIQDAQVVRQPRDGSGLYHALIHGLGHSISILQLRKEIVGFVRQHPDLEVHGHSLKTWIEWECLCRQAIAIILDIFSRHDAIFQC